MARQNRFQLRFADRELEDRFIAEYDAGHRHLIAWSAALGAGMHTLFLGLDYLAHPEHFNDFLTIRIVLALPPILLTIGVCLHSRWYRLAQHAGALAVTTSGLSIVWMIQQLSTSGNPSVAYSSGLILVLFFAYSFLRLRLNFALAGSLIFTVAYEVMLLGQWDWMEPHVLEQQYFVLGGHIIGGATCWTLEKANRRNFLAERELLRAHALTRQEREKSERLLVDMLPVSIAERLKEERGIIADAFDDVSVLFIDLVGFTPMAEASEPEEVVAFLDEYFARLDTLTDTYGVEKIKTIGDAYMVVSGAPEQRDDHATVLANLALECMADLEANPLANGQLGRVRMGLHCGPVVAGVIGRKRFSYDLWGSTVKLASRLESLGGPGKIHISEQMKNALGPSYRCTPCGATDIKGMGTVSAWFLDGTA